ncbi:MAG TPA: prolyl oligopeptidase family serine peptidase [bacterium]|nr:prolyl oligopeptidase family serine peptidase [bacterium]
MDSTAPRVPRLAGALVTVPGAGVVLSGWLFPPAAPGRAASAAVIVLHGWRPPGVWAALDVAGVARELATEGYAALALSLRGWPGSGGEDDGGLRQPDDIAAALDWLASRPGVDPARLGLLGFSQGGQVALLTAARSASVKAVVAYYPVTDIDAWRETTSFPAIRDVYVPRVCTPGGTRVRSPVDRAASITAAVMLIHGDRDTRVPTAQSVAMADALAAARRRVELVLVPEADHGFARREHPGVWRRALAFFEEHLRGETGSARPVVP